MFITANLIYERCCEFLNSAFFLPSLLLSQDYKSNLPFKPYFPANIFKKLLHQQPDKDTPERCEGLEKRSWVQTL